MVEMENSSAGNDEKPVRLSCSIVRAILLSGADLESVLVKWGSLLSDFNLPLLLWGHLALFYFECF